MNRSLSAVAACILGGLLSTSAPAEKVTVPTALEGYVRDEQGKGVEGVLVMVSEGSYTTQGMPVQQAIVRATTGIDIDTSDMVQNHDINTHFTKTDANGHYKFDNLLPGNYQFEASGKKKYAGDFRTHTDNLVPNKKLAAKYQFPGRDSVVIAGGETTIKDVVLHPLAIEICGVPKVAEPADARALNGITQKATQGNKVAMRLLGYTYQHGQHGVDIDLSQAVCWLRRAAQHGDVESMRAMRQLGASWIPLY